MWDFAVPSSSLQLEAVGVNPDSTARAATQAEQSERKLPIQVRVRGISCPAWEAEPCPVSSGPLSAHWKQRQPRSGGFISHLCLRYSPLVDVVGFKCVNSVDVRYVENWLIA